MSLKNKDIEIHLQKNKIMADISTLILKDPKIEMNYFSFARKPIFFSSNLTVLPLKIEYSKITKNYFLCSSLIFLCEILLD